MGCKIGLRVYWGPAVLNLPMETFVVRVVVYMALKPFLVSFTMFTSMSGLYTEVRSWNSNMKLEGNKRKLNPSNVCRSESSVLSAI